MRGIHIGYIKNLQSNLNSVIVLVHIESENILIPRHSIIETNQVGLFNNTTIDIIPVCLLDNSFAKKTDVFSSNCINSKFLCNNFYVQGHRGLNYDDLVRAATRISQRFDDPRIFNLLYIFLQNVIDVSDNTSYIIHQLSYYIYYLIKYL